jgi:hypothetical protein
MEDISLRDEMKAFKSPVDGHVIMKTFNIKEGKVIGLIKDDVENAILDEKIENDYDSAFNYMMKIKDKYL